MSLTPNYSFIIPTGSDAVNLLTQCYPNFTSLDSILKPIQESGVTVATDTKVGTVHQLVRTDSSCNMFRFIATGNYASGDTFTVDGASVTATAMDGTSLSAGAFVINQSVVCILNNLVLTVLVSGKETTSLPASAITYDNTGSGLTATNAQDAIDEVVTMIPATPTQHGFYELWKNPDITNSFGSQNVTLLDFDSTVYDQIIIEYEYGVGEGFGAQLSAFDRDVLSIPSYVGMLVFVWFNASNKFRYAKRNVSYVLTGTTLTISFGDASHQDMSTYGAWDTASIDNTLMVPVRILGLAHNS